jgi:phage/plasmid-associated DNA primase
MKLTNFLDQKKIPYFKFNMTIINGKKSPEPLPQGWDNMTYDQCMEYNKKRKNKFFINVIIKDSDYMVVDIDGREEEYLKKYGDINKTKSTGKGLPHLWRKQHSDDKNKTNRPNPSIKKDLLYKNSFEAIDSEFENYQEDFPIFEDYPEPPVDKGGSKGGSKGKKKLIPKKNSLSSNDSGFSEDMTITMPQKPKRDITDEDMEIIDNINIDYLDTYIDWLKIVWGLNNEFGNFDLIKKVSMRSEKYTNDEDLRKYIRNDKHKLMTFGTVCYYSKLSDKPKYLSIKAKHSELFFDDSDYELAKLYLNNSLDNVAYHGNNDYHDFYFFKNDFWVLDSNLNMIKKDMRDTLYDLFNEKRKELTLLPYDKEVEQKLKDIGKSIKLINTSSKQKTICEQIPIILERKDYKFDTNRPELFCFKNIGYNLDECRFEKLNKYDYISMNCGYDYLEPEDHQMEKITDFINEIQPNEETRECLKSVLRRGMYGKQDEYFVLFNGRGGNGKGALLELFKALLSTSYYEAGNTKVLTDKMKSSGANTELAKCDKKRTIVYSEPEDGNKLNGATIKYVTGNPVVNARQLYSKKTDTELHAMTIMECNERPPISGRVDNSFLRRIIDIFFPMNYLNSGEEIVDPEFDRIKDDSFKEANFQEDHKIALFHVLCDAKKSVYIPKCVKDRSEKYIMKNDDVYNFIFDTYEVTDKREDFVPIKDVFQYFKCSESYKLLSNDDKKLLNKSKFIDIVSSNPKLRKMFKERVRITIDGEATDYRSVFINLKTKEQDIN